MTNDESMIVEDLLDTWYRYEHSYAPALGAPRSSASCRGHQASDVHRDSDDRDVMLERITAEMVGSCIDDLHYLDRAAIGVHCRNKHAGASAHKSPRIEDQHRAYQDAKSLLWPKLKAKGLVR